jgi:hypothetical protein
VPQRLASGSIVHLHGVIRDLSRENWRTALVLDERSYVRQLFEKSPWYDEMLRDLRYCSSCIIAGYGLNDRHITQLLMQSPSFKAKTVFITKPNPDAFAVSRFELYGAVLPIGIESLASNLKTLPTAVPSGDAHSLKAFKYLDPFADAAPLARPTAIEIKNLLAYGNLNTQRLLSTLPAASYVAPRQRLVQLAVNSLKQVDCLVVHSRIGNGKTVFLHILSHALTREGYACFLCRGQPELLEDDLAVLRTQAKLVICFDNYSDAVATIPLLRSELRNVKFALTVRSGVYDVRQHEVQERLPDRRHELSLNELTRDDRREFIALLDEAGFARGGFKEAIRTSRDIREIVLTVYENSDITKELTAALLPVLSDGEAKRAIVTSALLSWLLDDKDTAAVIRAALGIDMFTLQRRFRSVATDLFQIDDEDVHIGSALLAEYLTRHAFGLDDVANAIYDMVVAAGDRYFMPRYRRISGSFMQFSNLRRVFSRDAQALERITGLYEKLRRDTNINHEPLFWLQYSIVMTEKGNLDLAERFLGTAYARAEDRPYFRTYQIDTHALRVLLLCEIASRDGVVPNSFAICSTMIAIEHMRFGPCSNFCLLSGPDLAHC